MALEEVYVQAIKLIQIIFFYQINLFSQYRDVQIVHAAAVKLLWKSHVNRALHPARYASNHANVIAVQNQAYAMDVQDPLKSLQR